MSHKFPVRIVVDLDPDLFDKIEAMTTTGQFEASRSAVLRLLLKHGLAAIKAEEMGSANGAT